MDEYYTTDQVAKILGIKNPITVRRWIAKRLVTAVKLGKEYRIAKEDLEKFIEVRKVKANK